MCEINKPENQQADLKCPFDLDKYQMKIDNLAPEGSLPWAIIQVYMGKAVARSEWEAPDEYIALKVKSPDSISHIEKHDKYGSSNWQPTPGDLMACDWKVWKPKCPEGTMLSFDLKVGTGKYSVSVQMWGYLADNELYPANPFGTLTNLKNETDITKFSYFVWDNSNKGIHIRVSSGIPPTLGGYQKMVDLFGKDLTVTVGGVPYYLGSTLDSSIVGKQQYEFFGRYYNTNAQKLGDILQQNVDKTLHFCFNWK